MMIGGAPIATTPISASDLDAYFEVNQVAASYEFVQSLVTLVQTKGRPCMQTVTIAQGESIGLQYGLGTSEIYEFQCEVAVISASGAVIHRQELVELNESGTRFVGVLSKDVTKGFEAGDYCLAADLWNDDTSEGREYKVALTVTAQVLEQIPD